MKKLLLVIVTILSIGILSAQTDELNGKVKEVKVSQYSALENFGDRTTDKLMLVYISKYNNDGLRTVWSMYSPNGELRIEQGYQYNDNKKLASVFTSEYNDKRQVIKGSMYDIDNESESTSNYTYNEDGKQDDNVQVSSVYGGGKLEYYDDGELIIVFWEDSDNKPRAQFTYEYTKLDDQNNWIERVAYRHGGLAYIQKREITYR